VVKPYIEERRVNYRVAIGSEEMAVSYGGVDSLPTTFVIDREGRIADVHIGLVTKKDYRDGILQILG
jgi:peroxiredoxin